MKKRTISIAIIAGLVIIILYNHMVIYPKKNSASLITVSVSTAKQKDITLNATAVGNVQAYTSVDVKSRVDGQVLSLGFKAGDIVKKDQLLFTIDSRPFEIAVEQAEANLARDKAALETAQLAHKRSTPLVKKGYISAQDYDVLRNNVNSLTATSKASEAALDNARLQLSFTKIYSPIDGRTGTVLVQIGNLVKANDSNPLVIINQIQPIYVVFSLPEEKLTNLRGGFEHQSIDVFVSTNKNTDNYTIHGKLTFIDNAVDTTTGTIQLKATFENADLRLWPGQFVKIKIPVDYFKQVITVPTPAVQAGPSGDYVFVVDQNNRIKMQKIKLIANTTDESIIEGLKPGTRVVVEGNLQLTEGIEVKPITESSS